MTPLPERADKATTAAWSGYPAGLKGIVALDAEHDNWHRALAEWLGLPSHSMRIADGKAVSGPQQRLAGLEEDAVLNLARYVQHMRNAGYTVDAPHSPAQRDLADLGK